MCVILSQLIYIHYHRSWESNCPQATFTISSDRIEYKLIILSSHIYINLPVHSYFYKIQSHNLDFPQELWMHYDCNSTYNLYKVFSSEGKLYYGVSYKGHIKVHDQAWYPSNVILSRGTHKFWSFSSILCLTGTASWKLSWPLEDGTLELPRKSLWESLVFICKQVSPMWPMSL